jgi:hypothetical protein
LLPAGTTVITGQMSHSRKNVFSATASPAVGAVFSIVISRAAVPEG